MLCEESLHARNSLLKQPSLMDEILVIGILVFFFNNLSELTINEGVFPATRLLILAFNFDNVNELCTWNCSLDKLFNLRFFHRVQVSQAFMEPFTFWTVAKNFYEIDPFHASHTMHSWKGDYLHVVINDGPGSHMAFFLAQFVIFEALLKLL